jgi:hypothetical protein
MNMLWALAFAAGALLGYFAARRTEPPRGRQYRLQYGETIRCGTCNATRAYFGGSPRCCKCGNMTWTYDDLPTE